MKPILATLLASVAMLAAAQTALAGKTALYTDDFNRPDGPLGAAWELSPFGPLPTLSAGQACTPAMSESVAFYASTFDPSESSAALIDVTASTLDSMKFGIIFANLAGASPVYFATQLRQDIGNTFHLEIQQGDESNTVLCSSSGVSLTAGQTYTFYMQWLPGGSVGVAIQQGMTTLASAGCDVGAQTPNRIVILAGRDSGTGTACYDNFVFYGTAGSPPAPVDCVVSAWSSFSSCSAACGGGTQTRTRTVITPAANGGAACPVLEESQACNGFPCPVDCVVSDWSEWGTCSATCGGGTQTRTRTVITPAAYGGAPCPAMSDYQSCNTQACENPGYVPTSKDSLKCATQVAKSVGKLSACLAKCASAEASDAAFDEATCTAECRAKYDRGSQKTVDKGICPDCLDTTGEQGGPADTAVTDAAAVTAMVYCDPTATGAALKCERAVSKALTKLGQCFDKCHAKVASSLLAGNTFDEPACRIGCRAKYDATSDKLESGGTCPTCLGATQQDDIADDFETARKGGYGDFYCEGTVPIP